MIYFTFISIKTMVPLKIPDQGCLDPEMTSNGPMGGWLAGRICVFMFGLQTWSPKSYYPGDNKPQPAWY
jgi:hypothetical protein